MRSPRTLLFVRLIPVYADTERSIITRPYKVTAQPDAGIQPSEQADGIAVNTSQVAHAVLFHNWQNIVGKPKSLNVTLSKDSVNVGSTVTVTVTTTLPSMV